MNRNCVTLVMLASTLAPASARAQALFVRSGNPAAGTWGAMARVIGDLDGDGIDDFAVGSQGESAEIDGVLRRGRVFLHSGATGSVLSTLAGEDNSLNNFGEQIASVPDVNGDGVPDVLVGAPTFGNHGRAYLFSGTDGELLYPVDLPTSMPGFAPNFGRSVGGLRDIDGDGAGDFVVGASRELYSGRAHVFSGAGGQYLYTLVGPQTQETTLFGDSICDAGDVTGDGVPDIAVGAQWEEVPGVPEPGNGRVYLFSGADGSLIRSFTSPNIRPRLFGGDIENVGDFDGDGVEDLLIGANIEKPPGSTISAGRAYIISGADSAVLAEFDSPNPQSQRRFGGSVAGVPDRNGDGVTDVLIGAYFEDPGQLPDQAGVVYLMSGADSAVHRALTSPWAVPFGGAFGRSALVLLHADDDLSYMVTAVSDDPPDQQFGEDSMAHVFRDRIADWNADMVVDSADFFAFILTHLGMGYRGASWADVNGDFATDSGDFFAFIQHFLAGT